MLESLPDDLIRQIQQLSERTGTTPTTIVRRALSLLNNLTSPSTDSDPKKFTKKVNDPKLVGLEPNIEFRRIYVQIRDRMDVSHNIRGAEARAKKLTDEERQEIGRKAAAVRWQKQKSNE